MAPPGRTSATHGPWTATWRLHGSAVPTVVAVSIGRGRGDWKYSWALDGRRAPLRVEGGGAGGEPGCGGGGLGLVLGVFFVCFLLYCTEILPWALAREEGGFFARWATW